MQRGHAAYHVPPTALLSLENTLNGAVQRPAASGACAQVARDAGARAHLDGARLWNACVALGCAPAELAAPFDTVSVCLSKALGAPVGSLLLGSGETMERARHLRKRHGGAWRQAGMLAAAGLHALREHRQRLEQDHEVARELAAGLQELGFELVQEVEQELNLFISAVSDTAALDRCARPETRSRPRPRPRPAVRRRASAAAR